MRNRHTLSRLATLPQQWALCTRFLFCTCSALASEYVDSTLCAPSCDVAQVPVTVHVCLCFAYSCVVVQPDSQTDQVEFSLQAGRKLLVQDVRQHFVPVGQRHKMEGDAHHIVSNQHIRMREKRVTTPHCPFLSCFQHRICHVIQFKMDCLAEGGAKSRGGPHGLERCARAHAPQRWQSDHQKAIRP